MSEQSRNFPQFYMTAPSPCPYLPGRVERKVFTHLAGGSAEPLNNALSLVGFRRSQNIAYRPACQACDACKSVRVIVDDFRQGRGHNRIVRRNRNLVARTVRPVATAEQFSVFRSYVDARHHDGGMAEMTSYDFAQMIEESQVDTHIVEYRSKVPGMPPGHAGGRLVAGVLVDRLQDGLSMIYSFFDPDEEERSLGTFMILDAIARARALGLPYLYLGYWVEGSDKMGYKSRFRPQERLVGNCWQKVD